MNMENNMVCRLCLKTPLSEFTLIDQTTREMLDVLLVKVNLDLSDNNLMCNDCLETVKRSLSFKCVSMASEGRILLSFNTDEHKSDVNLINVDACSSTHIIDLNHNTCRFCMKKFKEKNLIPLDVLTKEREFSCMVKIYLFWVDLNITKNPQICLHCRDNMESYFKFLQNCGDGEEKINEYRRSKGISSSEKITFSSVFEQFVKDVKGEEVCDSIGEIKEEFDREDTSVMDSFHQNDDTKNYVPCKTEDGTPFGCHEVSNQAAFDTGNIKIEPIPSDINDQTVKIETEELIIKDEVALTWCSTAGKRTTVKDISKAKKYECADCGYKTKCKGTLWKHMLSHKDISKVQAYRCGSCKFETKYKESIIRHSLVHKDSSEVQIYHCSRCEFQTRHRASLNNHMLVHKDSSEVQMYQCHNCEYRTKRKQNFKNHLLSHKDMSEVQVYRCDCCAYKTKYKSHLKIHMAPFKDSPKHFYYYCDRCTYKSKYQGNLMDHMMLIHKDSTEVQMYRCDKCDFKSVHKTSLRNHLTKLRCKHKA